MNCIKQTVTIETHYVDKELMHKGVIGKWYTHCKKCKKAIRLLEDNKEYLDNDPVQTYLEAEINFGYISKK